MQHEEGTPPNPQTPVFTPTSEAPPNQRDEQQFIQQRQVTVPSSMSDHEGTERQTPTAEPMGSAASSTVAATSTIATPATKDDIASVADQVSPKVDSANSPATITKGDKKLSCKKHKHNVSKKKDRLKKHKKNTKRKNVKEESSSEDDTTSESDASTSESEESESAESTPETSETDSESEKQKRKHKKSKHSKKNRRRRRGHRDEDDSDSDSSTSSEEDAIANRKALKRLKKRKAKKIAKKLLSDDEDEEEEVDSEDIEVRRRVANLRLKQAGSRRLQKLKEESGKKGKTKRASKVAFKRVDELWDSTIHNYKLRETLDDPDADEFDQYIFTVRRKFDWENKYMETVVDIKSKPLREALSTVMEGVKAVSLVTDKPIVDPNMLFLYLEEARAHMKELKKLVKTEKKKKARKLAAMKAAHLKVLIKYLDTDYAETKKTLYPLLDSNMITFDLLWALFKPNTIAYTPTYGHADEPRAFKIEYATKESSFMKGTWYVIEGKYLEYDGKTFGMGNMAADVESFKGARKITSLACYPLKYRRDADDVKTKLIERGKKFVALRGMNYRFHKGMAFFKKKRSVIKVNINGRVMIDPALHRRINPNYAISTVRPKDPDMLDSDSEEGSDDCCCCASSSEDDHANGNDDSEPPRPRYKFVRDKQGKAHIIEVEIDENGNEIPPKEDFDKLEKDKEGSMEEPELEFTEEELLIASPVVLGFAFGEKLWLEFSVSGVNEIEWNDGAFDSLVLPDNQKSIVKALVESHTFHAAENIDDVIQGKGKGLVAVLHGPPGTGKTLTAEGIAELLKRPLYMVSAGELGTDSRSLEGELNKILDIAHSWGAVLLLDEADVFLEKRTIQDIHRNALVSIFLRLLEYFQGILFLTTNRVETFDDAFQSRIHIALRYGDLTLKAKRSVWKMFLDKVKSIDGVQTSEFTDKDLDVLARHNLNGRQIKNSVRTAQALAVNEKSALSMSHIKRVLEVAETFEQDLKGGTGYMDAMRSYT